MALLNQDDNRPARRGPMLLLIGCGLTGCAVFTALGGGEKPLTFSHAVHAEEGLECGDCHISWEDEDAPGMPIKPGCDLCHDEIDSEKPPERHIGQLFDGETYKAQRVSKLSDEIIFSHLQHATEPVECNACHVGIETSDHVDTSLAMSMADCESCHKQSGIVDNCAACHQQLRTDVAPDTHAFLWLRGGHGRTVRAHSQLTANDCSLCHQESGCRECHQSMLPQNHNNYFRLRGHGLHARVDRQSCTTCHRSDSCDTCHQQTRPLNHTGAFAGTMSTHCISCHLQIERSECFTCHKGAPSHALATPLPPDHTPGMNCRQCHGAGQPLPHVDKGDACTACHR